MADPSRTDARPTGAAVDAEGALPVFAAVPVILLILLIHGALYFLMKSPAEAGWLYDADSYSRLVRVLHLHDTGGWFDSTLPRANAPYGDVLHWTRLFDLILLALAAPLQPFLDFDTALLIAGASVSPLLHALLGVAVMAGSAPLVGRHGAVLAGMLAGVQGGLLTYGGGGRADHHLLIALLVATGIGGLLHLLLDPAPRRGHALATGAVLATALWASPETLVLLALAMAGLGLPWLAGDRDAAPKAAWLCLGLTGGLALFLLIERGPAGYFTVEQDRLAIVHLSLAALFLGFWTVAARITASGDTPTRRRVLAAAGILTVAAVQGALFPRFFLGPLADVHPGVGPFFAAVYENQPTLRLAPFDPSYFLVMTGATVLALPYGAWRLWHSRERERSGWRLVVLALVIYTALAVTQVRWTPFSGLITSLVVADAVGRLGAAVAARTGGPLRALAEAMALVTVVLAPLVIGSRLLTANAPGMQPDHCPLPRLAPYLNDPAGWGAHSRTILTLSRFGPELLYRTGHRVIGTSYHRNHPGILDTLTMLGATDDRNVRPLLDQRRIDLVLVCVQAVGGLPTVPDIPGTLYNRLRYGPTPDWLRPVTLPSPLDEPFRLFEVVRP